MTVALAGCSETGQGTTAGRIPTISPTAPSPAPTVEPRLMPAKLYVAKLSATSTLPPFGLKADGSLATPDDHTPKQAGFYCVVDAAKLCSSGVLPGQVGPAVVMGHINGAKQKGIFADLPTMVKGDTAQVTLTDGTVLNFVVYRVMSQAKTAFPASVVYGATPVPELRLITCSGKFKGGKLGYEDNTIVFLSLVPTSPGE